MKGESGVYDYIALGNCIVNSAKVVLVVSCMNSEKFHFIVHCSSTASVAAEEQTL